MFNFYTQRAWLYKIYYFLFSWKRTLFTACPASLILCFNFVLFFNSDCSCDLKWSSSVLSLSLSLIGLSFDVIDLINYVCAVFFSVSVFQNVGICCCCCCLTNSRDEGKNRSGICLNLLLLRVWLVEKVKLKKTQECSILPARRIASKAFQWWCWLNFTGFFSGVVCGSVWSVYVVGNQSRFTFFLWLM